MAIDPKDEEKPKAFTMNGTEYPALADGNYDVIIMGTGLKECVLSGLLAVKGMRVLILDRNDFYGSACASLNIDHLHRKFVDKDKDAPEAFVTPLGQKRSYAVDLIPKFIMANGKLVKILVHTNVTRYLEFKQIDGSFVYKSSSDSVHKVPATEMEALSTGLMGFFQKRKFRNFLQWVAKVDPADPSTFDGMDPRAWTTRQVFEKFGLDSNSQDFAGHAMALHSNEAYLDRPVLTTVKAVKLYARSLERYGKSPYIYPMWGLGGMPEGFSRLCAVHGGTFMLHAKDPELVFEDGKIAGVIATEPGGTRTAARAPIVIGEPSYFAPEKTRRVGQVIRSICILTKPVAAIGGVDSGQIIIPQNQVGRKNDIYITVVGAPHQVAAPGRFIAIVSTTVETKDPRGEVAPGIKLLGDILYRFDDVADFLVPTEDNGKDGCWVSSSYDASSHFETTADDILEMYAKVTGEPLNMDIPTTIPEE